MADLHALHATGCVVGLVVHANGCRLPTAASGRLDWQVVSSARRLAIGHARERLQRAVFTRARELGAGAAWILDDDVRLTPVFDKGGSSYLQDLVGRMRSSGVAVGSGVVVGDAPIPSSLTLRVQLEDVVDAIHHDRSGLREATQRSSLYHDLHQPIRPVPSLEAVSRNKARWAADALRRIADGTTVTRRLTVDDNLPGVETQVRGGNTLILDLEALVDAPNRGPCFGGREARRGDTVWAIVQRHLRGRRVVDVDLPVLHRRRAGDGSAPCPARLRDDLLGHASCYAIEHWLGAGGRHCQLGEIRERFARRLEERRMLAERSISGALENLSVLGDLGVGAAERDLAEAAATLQEVVVELRRAVRPGAFEGSGADFEAFCLMLMRDDRLRVASDAAAE